MIETRYLVRSALIIAFAGWALYGCAHSLPSAPTPARPASFLDDTVPPLVAGIRIGDPIARVRAMLGEPTRDEAGMADARQLAYWSRGLIVLTTGVQGVAMIGQLTPAAPRRWSSWASTRYPTASLAIGRSVGAMRRTIHGGAYGLSQRRHEACGGLPRLFRTQRPFSWRGGGPAAAARVAGGRCGGVVALGAAGRTTALKDEAYSRRTRQA